MGQQPALKRSAQAVARRQWLLALAAAASGLALPRQGSAAEAAGVASGASADALARQPAPAQAPIPASQSASASAVREAKALDDVALTAAATAADLHSLLVWRRGELLHAGYRTSADRPIGSWWARQVAFGPDVLHDMRSISKSVVALLVGQAVGRGLIALDAPVLDFYPDLADLRQHRDGPGGSGPGDITVAHLLHMASGLAWNEGLSTYGTSANDESRLAWQARPERHILDRPLVAVPGSQFLYNGGCTALLADILQQRTGETLLSLVARDLFTPLGITPWAWQTGSHGQPLAYAGLRLTSPDLLKIGRLMLAGGQWAGRQVVPAAWVAATLQPAIASATRPGPGALLYGHQWWAGTVAVRGQSQPWTAAFGNGGQRLFLLPALDLLVVMTAGQYNSASIGPAQMRLFRQVVAQL